MVINFRICIQTSTLIKKKLNENRFIYYYNIKNVSQLLKKTFSSFLKKRKKKKKGSCHKIRETEGRRSVAVRLNKKSALMVILIYKKAYPTQLTFNSWHGCMSGSACDLICHVFFFIIYLILKGVLEIIFVSIRKLIFPSIILKAHRVSLRYISKKFKKSSEYWSQNLRKKR